MQHVKLCYMFQKNVANYVWKLFRRKEATLHMRYIKPIIGGILLHSDVSWGLLELVRQTETQETTSATHISTQHLSLVQNVLVGITSPSTIPVTTNMTSECVFGPTVAIKILSHSPCFAITMNHDCNHDHTQHILDSSSSSSSPLQHPNIYQSKITILNKLESECVPWRLLLPHVVEHLESW